MKALLAVAIVGSVMFVAGSVVASSQQTASTSTCGQFDVKGCDLDGDGSVSILDLTLMAQHFTQNVGTPYACGPRVHYATPEVWTAPDGTQMSVEGYGYPAAGDPRIPDMLSGTAVNVVPCP